MQFNIVKHLVIGFATGFPIATHDFGTEPARTSPRSTSTSSRSSASACSEHAVGLALSRHLSALAAARRAASDDVGSSAASAARTARCASAGSAPPATSSRPATTTLLIDPFLYATVAARGSLGRIAPDEAAIRARLPARVDAVLCGHSHFDHLLDAPFIARTTGATLVGSDHDLHVRARQRRRRGAARRGAARRAARFTVGDAHDSLRAEPARAHRLRPRAVPGRGRGPPPLPARAWHYRMGGAFGILVEAGGLRIYHNGSADLIDAELDGARADVLLVGLAGRESTRDYLERLCDALAATAHCADAP